MKCKLKMCTRSFELMSFCGFAFSLTSKPRNIELPSWCPDSVKPLVAQPRLASVDLLYWLICRASHPLKKILVYPKGLSEWLSARKWKISEAKNFSAKSRTNANMSKRKPSAGLFGGTRPKMPASQFLKLFFCSVCPKAHLSRRLKVNASYELERTRDTI